MANRRHTADDALMTRIGQVVMLHRGGDREEARSRFLLLWAELAEHGDPLHRCTLAHFLAGTQEDPLDALAWDLRALSAAEELTRRGAGGPAGCGMGEATGPVAEGAAGSPIGPAAGERSGSGSGGLARSGAGELAGSVGGGAAGEPTGLAAEGVAGSPIGPVAEAPAGERPAGRLGGPAAARALYPSLHLSLAADYARLHRPAAARSHLRQARRAAGTLPAGGHRTGLRSAIGRLERRLAADDASDRHGGTPDPPGGRPRGSHGPLPPQS